MKPTCSKRIDEAGRTSSSYWPLKTGGLAPSYYQKEKKKTLHGSTACPRREGLKELLVPARERGR